MKMKEENEKVGLKLNIQKMKIMASGPITSRQMETAKAFILGGSKITADGASSHEIKRCLLLWRKAMTNLDSILKCRDITLPAKVHLVKAMIFLGVMYGCESWTIKKAECRRIDAFELWCWRRLLRVPWAARRSNQSILKEISPVCSLEGLMLKLKLQYFVEKAMENHSSTLAWKIPWLEEPGGLQSMGSLRVGYGWVTSLSFFTFMHWRRKWQPTPVFLPWESQGMGSLEGCCLWGQTRLKWLRRSSNQYFGHLMWRADSFKKTLIFVYGVRKCSSFILLQVIVQFSQHHLLKRLSFFHCISLPPLSKIRCP